MRHHHSLPLRGKILFGAFCGCFVCRSAAVVVMKFLAAQARACPSEREGERGHALRYWNGLRYLA